MLCSELRIELNSRTKLHFLPASFKWREHPSNEFTPRYNKPPKNGVCKKEDIKQKMLSIQESVNKTQEQTKKIEEYMDTHGYFDPYECNVYEGLKPSIRRELQETFRRTNLKEWLTSTQLSTGTLGAGGAQYLVPAYVSQRLYQGMSYTDIAPAVAADVIENQAGETVYVNALAIALAQVTHGGEGSLGGMKFNNATLTLEHIIAPLAITNEMREDNQYMLMEACITGAGTAMAKQSNDKICAMLKRTTGTTGWGTKTTETAGADTTTPANLATCAAEVAAGDPTGVGMYRPNLIVTTSEPWNDALITTAGHPEVQPPRNPMYRAWYGGYDVVIVNSQQMGGTVASNRLPNAVTIVMEKEVGCVVARNNWLRVENYVDPIKDLAGAVVSGRQGQGELVDAAIGILTES